jgi:hypothetical protein
MRSFRLSYEIDVDADTVEEAVRQATEMARDTRAIATWSVLSTESHMGEPQPEISVVASLLPSGDVEIDGNESERL